MLAEFVLTPNLFGGDDEELRSRLRDLRELLLPRRGAPIALVCRLGGKQWETESVKKIRLIGNSSLQSDAKKLFEKLSELTVDRPSEGKLTNASERLWVECAQISHALAPLDAVVTSSKYERPLCKDMAAFSSDEFWQAYENPRHVSRTILSQFAGLRTVCQHADWIIVRMPQIRGDSVDEIVTVKQIIDLASRRLHGQTRCSIDVHLCQQKNIPDQTLLRNVENELCELKPSIDSLTFSLYPAKTFVDRELIAGEWAPMPNNARKQRARWCISMSHVAVRTKRDSGIAATNSTWSLFDRRTADGRLDEVRALTPLSTGTVELTD